LLGWLPRSLLGDNPLFEIGRFRRLCRARRENKNKSNNKGRIYDGTNPSTVYHLLFLNPLVSRQVKNTPQKIIFLQLRLIEK
jgi:hypothetical protein